MEHYLQSWGSKWDRMGTPGGVRALHCTGALKLLSSSAELDSTLV